MAERSNIATVWQQPDDAYRMSLLEIIIEGESITQNPPTYVKECTLMADENYGEYEMSLVLFDATWLTIPRILKLGLNEDRITDIILSMGWSFPGGALENLQGRILTLKQDVTPDGIEYTIRGRIGPGANVTGNNFRQSYMGLISDIAAVIAEEVYGIPKDKHIIEHTTGYLSDEYKVKEGTTPSAFLGQLMSKAVPMQRAIPPGMSESDVKGLYNYSFNIDTDGYFHFHTTAFGMANEIANGKQIDVKYPYPADGNPIISLDIADVEWSDIRMSVGVMDRTYPTIGDDSIIAGPSGGLNVVDLRLMLPAGYTDDQWDQIVHIQSNMAKRSFSADIVMLGNPYIKTDTPFNVQITGGDLKILDVQSHLSGIYVARQVVHSVANDTFITRCNLQKYFWVQ